MLDEHGLTPKQKKFCDVVLETGNASEAARQAYNIGGKGGNTDPSKGTVSCGPIGDENLKKPAIKGYLESEVVAAKIRIVELAESAEMEPVRLAANKDICDRTEGKAQQRIDHTSGGKSFVVPEEKRDIVNARLNNLIIE